MDTASKSEGTSEEAKCLEAFSAFDRNSLSKIDANELWIVLEIMGFKATEKEI
jgi:Ca2+-binding EF-hand superfamily protein